MNFLVSVPIEQISDSVVLEVKGSGLDWKAVQVTIPQLMESARKNIRFENVELRVLTSKAQVPPGKDKLVYEVGKQFLWIDTKPMASSRFTSKLAVVVQEIQSGTGSTLGYVVAFPDGRVIKVAGADLLKYCEAARVQGKHAVQNMQYVSANGVTAAHLKNYEGRTVPVYIQQRAAVNAENMSNTHTAVFKESEVTPAVVPEVIASASSVFTPEQLEVLGRGKKESVDIRVYANPVYSPKYMDAFRRVLVARKSPALLQGLRDGKPVLSDEMAAFYSYEMVQGADIRPYFNNKYDLKQAVQVKLGFARGLDITKYSDPSIDGDEMEQLRVRLDADTWSGMEQDKE